MSMKVIALLMMVILTSSVTSVYAVSSNELMQLKYKDPNKSKYYLKVTGGKHIIDVYTYGDSGDYEKTLTGSGSKKYPIKCDYHYNIDVVDAKKGTLIEIYKNNQRLDGLRVGNNIDYLDGSC